MDLRFAILTILIKLNYYQKYQKMLMTLNPFQFILSFELLLKLALFKVAFTAFKVVFMLKLQIMFIVYCFMLNINEVLLLYLIV